MGLSFVSSLKALERKVLKHRQRSCEEVYRCPPDCLKDVHEVSPHRRRRREREEILMANKDMS